MFSGNLVINVYLALFCSCFKVECWTWNLDGGHWSGCGGASLGDIWLRVKQQFRLGLRIRIRIFGQWIKIPQTNLIINDFSVFKSNKQKKNYIFWFYWIFINKWTDPDPLFLKPGLNLDLWKDPKRILGPGSHNRSVGVVLILLAMVRIRTLIRFFGTGMRHTWV